MEGEEVGGHAPPLPPPGTSSSSSSSFIVFVFVFFFFFSPSPVRPEEGVVKSGRAACPRLSLAFASSASAVDGRPCGRPRGGEEVVVVVVVVGGPLVSRR